MWLNIIELEVEPGHYPEVFAAYFSDETWIHERRYFVASIKKDDQEAKYQVGRIVFEALPGLTTRVLGLNAGFRWGAAFNVGGIQVSDGDIAQVLERSPFLAADARHLEPLCRAAWASRRQADRISVWVKSKETALSNTVIDVLKHEQ